MLVSRFVKIERCAQTHGFVQKLIPAGRGKQTTLVTDIGHELVPDIALGLRCQLFDRPPELCPMLVAGWHMTLFFRVETMLVRLRECSDLLSVFLILHYLNQRKTKKLVLTFVAGSIYNIIYCNNRVYALFLRTREDAVTREI